MNRSEYSSPFNGWINFKQIKDFRLFKKSDWEFFFIPNHIGELKTKSALIEINQSDKNNGQK